MKDGQIAVLTKDDVKLCTFDGKAVKPKVDTVVSRVYNEPEYLLGDYDIEYIPDNKKKKKIEPEIQYEVKKRRNLIKSNVIEK